MATNVSEFIIQRIQDWGVSRVFRFPGDGIGEFDGMLGKADRDGTGSEYVRPTNRHRPGSRASSRPLCPSGRRVGRRVVR
jgi:hypothetical protein